MLIIGDVSTLFTVKSSMQIMHFASSKLSSKCDKQTRQIYRSPTLAPNDFHRFIKKLEK